MKLGDCIKINNENLKKDNAFEEIIYIDIKSIGEGVINERKKIRMDEAPSRAKRVVQVGNTILSTVRPRNRSFYYFKEAEDNTIVSTGFAVLQADEKKIDGRYLYYYISNPAFTAYLANNEKGSAYPAITADVIENKEVDLPPLVAQKKIASILSTYDDLIENNLKRIKLLEEAAQRIYKEWFVDLKFPNRESTPMNPETGLPEGWEKGTVGDLVIISSGYAFKSKDWQAEGNPVIKIKNLQNNTVNLTDTGFVNDEIAAKAINFEIFEGDILIAMTGATVGKIGLVPKKYNRLFLNQRVGLFRPFEHTNNVPFIFSFFLSQDAQKQVMNLAQGAAQPNISSTQIGSIKLSIPNEDILILFNEKIGAFLNQIQVLQYHSQNLKEARDLLLPRLMNRTIEV